VSRGVRCSTSSPQGEGGSVSARVFAYACEKCSDTVALSDDDFRARKGRVLCDTHGGRQAAPEPVKTARRRNAHLRAEHPASERLNLTPGERDDYGVTVTVQEQDSGAVDVIVGKGPVRKALLDVCNQIDGRTGCWRVITISSPASIFRDLQGMRDTELVSLEAAMLGQAHRLDLLARSRVVMRVVTDEDAA